VVLVPQEAKSKGQQTEHTHTQLRSVVRKSAYVLFGMITENRAHSSFLFTDALDFCLWRWRKSEVHRMKVHTRGILDAAAA
jgi:hypothetical protein